MKRLSKIPVLLLLSLSVSACHPYDVMTYDIIIKKVSGTLVPVVAPDLRGTVLSSSIYIYYLMSYNVIMSLAPVCRGFLHDIIYDVSVFSIFRHAPLISMALRISRKSIPNPHIA